MDKIFFVSVIMMASTLAFAGCLGGGNSNTLDAASYCSGENVAEVHECDDGSVMVVSELLGGGYTVYKTDGTSFQCPVVAMDQMSQECLDFIQNAHCDEQNACET